MKITPFSPAKGKLVKVFFSVKRLTHLFYLYLVRVKCKSELLARAQKAFRYKDIKRFFLSLAIYAIDSDDSRLIAIRSELHTIFSSNKIPEFFVWIFSKLGRLSLVLCGDAAVRLSLEPNQVNSFIGWYSSSKLVAILLKIQRVFQNDIPFSVFTLSTASDKSLEADSPLKYTTTRSADLENKELSISENNGYDKHETIDLKEKGTDSSFSFGNMPEKLFSLEDKVIISYPSMTYSNSVGFCIAFFFDFRVPIAHKVDLSTIVDSVYEVEIDFIELTLISLLDWFCTQHSKPKPTSKPSLTKPGDQKEKDGKATSQQRKTGQPDTRDGKNQPSAGGTPQAQPRKRSGPTASGAKSGRGGPTSQTRGVSTSIIVDSPPTDL
jgi:hypothetical protein